MPLQISSCLASCQFSGLMLVNLVETDQHVIWCCWLALPGPRGALYASV